MKQKPANRTTMNDLLDEYQMNSPKNKQISLQNESVNEEVWNQEELSQIAEYNKNIFELDTLYASVKPINSYIVRVFLFEPVVDNGVLVPYKQIVAVPTNNGMADFAEIESPYPYSNRAVIVSTPEMTSILKPGDVVQLGSNPVKPQVNGRGYNARVSIPAAYVHPSTNSLEIPKNINDRHYGYLIIPLHEIIAKL